METKMIFFIAYPLLMLLVLYLVILRNLKCSKIAKVLIFLVAACAGFKNQIILFFGGDILAPELPRNLLIFFSSIHVVLIFTLGLALFYVIVKWLFKILKSIFKKNFSLSFASFSGLEKFGIFIIGLILAIYATVEALETPVVTNYTFESSKYPKLQNNKPYRIVQITDTHFGSNATVEQVKEFVKIINEQNPDIVLYTGDLIDGAPKYSEDQLKEFLKVKAPIYAINGNHEYYSNTKLWKDVWKDFNINMLYNEHITINQDGKNILTIAGLTDVQALKMPNVEEGPDIHKALEGSDKALPVVLMVHRPERFYEYAKEGVDLMLSGHTHGGMLPVLKQIVAFFNNGLVSGLYLDGESKLIVSNGTFTWGGFCARINTPSEVVVIDLVHKD